MKYIPGKTTEMEYKWNIFPGKQLKWSINEGMKWKSEKAVHSPNPICHNSGTEVRRVKNIVTHRENRKKKKQRISTSATPCGFQLSLGRRNILTRKKLLGGNMKTWVLHLCHPVLCCTCPTISRTAVKLWSLAPCAQHCHMCGHLCQTSVWSCSSLYPMP